MDIIPIIQTKENTLEKTDDMSVCFFRMALEDLESSEILYQYKKYSQSIFYLQQAVEKGFKAYGIKFSLPKNDPQQNHHNPLLMVTKLIEQQRRKQNMILRDNDRYSRINDALKKMGVSYDDIYLEFKENSVKVTNTIDENAHEYDVSNEKLITLIEDMNVITSKFNDIKNVFDSETTSKIVNLIFDLTPHILDENQLSSIVSEDIPIEQKKEKLTKAFEGIRNMDGVSDFNDKFMSMLFLMLGSFILFINLALITIPHAAIARYPQNKISFDPYAYYTDELPLVQHLPELQTYTRVALEWLEKLYNVNGTVLINSGVPHVP